MVLASETPRGSAALQGSWGWFVGLGVVSLAGGIIALFSVLFATVIAVTWVGAMMVLSGVFEIFHGFRMRSWGRFALWIAIGALYALGGVFTFLNPLLASAVLTLMLGVFLIVAGTTRIVLATQMRPGSSWAWVAASGVVTLLLGAMIVLGWPVSSLYTLGIFLGVDLVVAGLSWLGLGLALRGGPARR